MILWIFNCICLSQILVNWYVGNMWRIEVCTKISNSDTYMNEKNTTHKDGNWRKNGAQRTAKWKIIRSSVFRAAETAQQWMNSEMTQFVYTCNCLLGKTPSSGRMKWSFSFVGKNSESLRGVPSLPREEASYLTTEFDAVETSNRREENSFLSHLSWSQLMLHAMRLL